MLFLTSFSGQAKSETQYVQRKFEMLTVREDYVCMYNVKLYNLLIKGFYFSEFIKGYHNKIFANACLSCWVSVSLRGRRGFLHGPP